MMPTESKGHKPPATRGGARGPYAKSVEVQASILDAALEVFAQGGFRSGSIRAIARRVEMSEAGLLHHFESKWRLLEAVLQRRDELARSIVPVRSENGVDTLRGLVELARFNAGEPGVVELYCVVSAEATSPKHPAHKYFVRRYEQTRETVLAGFTSVAAQGLLRPGVTPEAATYATLAMMDGLQIQWLLDRSLLDMAEELRAFLRLLTLVDL
jgi:AcrR family transcriptional regulator